MSVCFFADWDAGPCDGQLIRAHLVPRQLLKREFPHGVVHDGGRWRKLERGEDCYGLERRTARHLVNDPRSWVPCCGGPTGIGGHHGQLDGGRLRVQWEALPLDLIVFCDELGLSWWLERRYGVSGVPVEWDGRAA